MTKQGSNEAGPVVKLEATSPVHCPQPASSNVFTNFIKKVPYSQISPALKRRAAASKSVPADSHASSHDQSKRSTVSQIFHSVPDAVKKKFSRSGAPSPDLSSINSWGSEDTLEYDNSERRASHFSIVLDQIKASDTPLLRNTRLEPVEASQITMAAPVNDPDNYTVDSDDENVDVDGLFSSIFRELTSVVDVERELIKVKSEIEVTQRNNTELTKKYLEVSKTVSDSQIPDLATREQYNQKNLKSQKHVRELQNKLKKLEERKKKIREQELMNNGYVQVDPQDTTHSTMGHETLDGKRTPDQTKKSGVIHRAYEKAVAKRRKTRTQDDKSWGSDGAIDQSSGVIELAEAIGESISSSSREPILTEHVSEPSVPVEELSNLASDDEDQSPVNNDEFENVSDKTDITSFGRSKSETSCYQRTHGNHRNPADSVSNLSEGVNDGLNKLREDYLALLSEVKELRDTYKDGIMLVNANLAKQHDYFVEAIQEGNMRIRQIDDRVDDKLDKFHYSSDERIKEIEERLDDYKYKMTKFEELQEQKRMEHPLTGNDIATRGRDVMSSVISLGLASVSLLLFLFTTAVDCLKVFSENNALSTGLSLGLFGVIIATYYYFDTERTSL
ncbi:uncharacterized protein LOC134823411 isoform X3 [Bolinopsis microptera]|uniref:uncharacterized protein LOC134823411 isoform X3 n=1 Tax=Bolinopsis microptera TaxID=2820187 RepID=UPI003078C54C